MTYLTFDEYQEMGGVLDETAFNDLEFEAETYVDWYTFDRLRNETDIPDRVKKCMYHIIKLLNDQITLFSNDSGSGGSSSDSTNKQIASQSNDGVSVRYNIISASEALELAKNDVNQTIKRYLQGLSNSLGRKLLYRGIYPDE